MVVKDKIGRKRYVIVYNTDNLSDILKHIHLKFHMNLRFILKLGHYSIIKIPHYEKNKFLELLMEFNVPTMKTTGTLKKAKEIIKNKELGH
ncbi:MAG: hypothetical protein ACP5F1_04430 [Thermoplasmata archaeon]|nr:hypothetical protein [Thermoplasmata archaeon]